MQLVSQRLWPLQGMLHCDMFHETCPAAMSPNTLRDKLHETFHSVTEPSVRFAVTGHVGLFVRNKWGLLSIARHEWFWCKGGKWKIYSRKLVLLSEHQLWTFHIIIWQTTSRTCGTIIFPHSTNQIIDLPSSFLKLPSVCLHVLNNSSISLSRDHMKALFSLFHFLHKEK